MQVRDLSFTYGKIRALEGIDLDLPGGNLVGLVGPNGSGKSTLLKCMDRLLAPDRPRAKQMEMENWKGKNGDKGRAGKGSGTILLDGVDIASMSARDVARRIGYVPQSTSTVFSKTVFETVLMGRIPHGGWAPSGRDNAIAMSVLDELGMSDLACRELDSLSGGQRQKVIIGRAMAQEPHVLLLDEPTSALDLANQIDVMEILGRQTASGRLVVMAVHDLNLALRYCDSFVFLKAGRVVARGDPDAITRELLEDVYDVRATIVGQGRERVFVPVARR